MEDYIKKFNDAVDSHIVMLDGTVITKKNKEVLNVYRDLENRLKQLLAYNSYEAIDYDKVIEVLVQEYVAFVNYLIEFILKGRMSWAETLEEKVEADESKSDQSLDRVAAMLSEPTKDEEPKKLKPIVKKKKPVKRK